MTLLATVLAWALAAAAYADGPPMNVDLPTIAGTPTEGDTLTADPGTWSGDTPITYSYVWSDGQTGSTDTLSSADVGQSISVTVTAFNDAGQQSETIAAVGPVIAATPVNTGVPVITGTAQQGNTLSVSNGAWSTDPNTEYAYAWEDCDSAGNNCAPIGGATSSSYTLQPSDVRSTIVAAVTASNGGETALANSAHTGPVLAWSTTGLLTDRNPVLANQSVTLIATVTASTSSVAPSGTITFESSGAPIAGCSSAPVLPTGQSVTVVCSTSFPASTPQLSAVYAPSTGSPVAGSTSPTYSLAVGPVASSTAPGTTSTVTGSSGVSPTVSGGSRTIPALPAPVAPQLLGAVTATMQWTFYYAPSYTVVRALMLSGVPRGATVLVKCRGRGCPFARRAVLATQIKPCRRKTRGLCTTAGGVDLALGFANRRLAVGTHITVEVARPNWVGKYYAFTVRPRRGPRVQIACLAPGGAQPGAAC